MVKHSDIQVNKETNNNKGDTGSKARQVRRALKRRSKKEARPRPTEEIVRTSLLDSEPSGTSFRFSINKTALKKSPARSSRSPNAPTILVAWRGPSQNDGNTIRVVLYCLRGGSKSRKTGPMAQVLICPDDVPPHVSVKTGTDFSVCGNCPLRPASGGGCYCNLGAYFPRVWETSNDLSDDLNAACEALHRSGLRVRIGSWGDPAAVPFDVIAALTASARGPNGKACHTAYTAAWETCDPRLREIAMASVLSETEMTKAERAGWATLRIRTPDMPVLQGEVIVLGKLACDDIFRVAFGGCSSEGPGPLNEKLQAAAMDSLVRCSALMGIVQDQSEPQPAHKPDNGNGSQEKARITRKQLDYAYMLGRDLGLSRDQLADRCLQTFGKKPEYLDRTEASNFIETMKKEVKK